MPDRIRLSEIPLPAVVQPPAAVPPPRFDEASFGSYLPANESQSEACEAVKGFVNELGARRGGFRWPWQRQPPGRGLYLDGGYGVGKTHLLAAAFHAAAVNGKAYLTFQELVHLIGALGIKPAQERFAGVSLLCLDEFELDDPGNTLIVKRFLESLFERGGSVITTSNTPPEAQGQGRFNAEDFRREIQGIAARFTAVSVAGSDFRRRDRPAQLLDSAAFERELDNSDAKRPIVVSEFSELIEILRSLHPIRYRALIDRIGTLFVRDVQTISQQNDALRFVHFIDRLYDQQVGLRASGEIAIGQIFDPSYRRSAYQRKHERCASRLGELLVEPLGEEHGERTQMRCAQGFD